MDSGAPVGGTLLENRMTAVRLCIGARSLIIRLMALTELKSGLGKMLIVGRTTPLPGPQPLPEHADTKEVLDIPVASHTLLAGRAVSMLHCHWPIEDRSAAASEVSG
jgi:hypothetical protein